MEISKIFGGHLDIFKEVKRGEQSILVKNTLFKDVDIPDYIGVNFDFENKVVIFLNKKSQQTLLLCAGEVRNKEENQIQFGK